MKNKYKFWLVAAIVSVFYSISPAQFIGPYDAYRRAWGDSLSDSSLFLVQYHDNTGNPFSPVQMRSMYKVDVANWLNSSGGDASFDSLYANKGVFGTLSATTVYFNDTAVDITDSVLRIINDGHNAFFDTATANVLEVFGTGPSPLRVKGDSGITTGKWKFGGTLSVTSANKLTVGGDTVATLNNLRSFVQSGDEDAAFHDVSVSNGLILSGLTDKNCIGTGPSGNVIEGSCGGGGGIDSSDASGLISDSLDAAVRSGTQNISVYDGLVNNLLDSKGLNYFGDLTGGEHAVTIDVDKFEVDESITPDFYSSLNVHGALSVGDAGNGENSIIINPGGGSDHPGIVGGGDALVGDSLNYGIESFKLGPGPYGTGNIRLFAALHHVDGVDEVIEINPVESDPTLGAVIINGASVTVSSLSTGDPAFVCVDSGGLLYASASACIAP